MTNKTEYPSEMKKALGDMADNVKRHRNRASNLARKRTRWMDRALAAEEGLRVIANLPSTRDFEDHARSIAEQVLGPNLKRSPDVE